MALRTTTKPIARRETAWSAHCRGALFAQRRGGVACNENQCALLCLECARCNVISFSLAARECDWFHDCDPTFLKTVTKPWKTTVVRQLQPPPERLMRTVALYTTEFTNACDRKNVYYFTPCLVLSPGFVPSAACVPPWQMSCLRTVSSPERS